MKVVNANDMKVPMTVEMEATFRMTKEDTGFSAEKFANFESYLREQFPGASVGANGSYEYVVRSTLLVLPE